MARVAVAILILFGGIWFQFLSDSHEYCSIDNDCDFVCSSMGSVPSFRRVLPSSTVDVK